MSKHKGGALGPMSLLISETKHKQAPKWPGGVQNEGDGDNSCLKRRRSLVKSIAAPCYWGGGHRQARFSIFKKQTEALQRLLIRAVTKPKLLGRRENRDTTKLSGQPGKGGMVGRRKEGVVSATGQGLGRKSALPPTTALLWNHSLETRLPVGKECDRDQHPGSLGEP